MPDLFHKIDAYWRAANYLSVEQIYLFDNPLLRRPLVLADVKPMLLGHWGTTPGQNFIYALLNRVIKEHDLDIFYVCGPVVVANTFLEGPLSEVYPDITQHEAGLRKLFARFELGHGLQTNRGHRLQCLILAAALQALFARLSPSRLVYGYGTLVPLV